MLRLLQLVNRVHRLGGLEELDATATTPDPQRWITTRRRRGASSSPRSRGSPRAVPALRRRSRPGASKVTSTVTLPGGQAQAGRARRTRARPRTLRPRPRALHVPEPLQGAVCPKREQATSTIYGRLHRVLYRDGEDVRAERVHVEEAQRARTNARRRGSTHSSASASALIEPASAGSASREARQRRVGAAGRSRFAPSPPQAARVSESATLGAVRRGANMASGRGGGRARSTLERRRARNTQAYVTAGLQLW